MADPVTGVHLVRTEENAEEIDALAALLGGRPGLPGLLTDLNRRARRSWAPGRATGYAFTWDAVDRRTHQWWPQGISGSWDASPDGLVEGRRLAVASWYAKDVGSGNHGSRLTFVDLGTLRYRHVLLVVPTLDEEGRPRLSPLRIHAGGVVWVRDHLHVAATGRGIVTVRPADLMWVPEGATLDTFGHRWVLPVRLAYEAWTGEGLERLRYSFLSLDQQPDPPQVLAGEYGRGDATRRLVRYDVDPGTGLLATGQDGTSRPLLLEEGGVRQMQGAVAASGVHHVTVSHGPWMPGSVYVGQPGDFRRRRWAVPMGPEDVAYHPHRDELWSLSEHPRRRWVFAVPRRRLD